jgi:hypothetical protein
MKFDEVVMKCFDNKEFVRNWERLRKKKLKGDKNMLLFIEDVKDLVWDRVPSEPEKCPHCENGYATRKLGERIEITKDQCQHCEGTGNIYENPAFVHSACSDPQESK